MFATLLGGFLGIFDGLTALFTPEVRDQIAGIVVGSTFKGLVAGVLIGVFARRVHSLVWVLIFGVLVSGVFAYLVAMMQGKYYLQIITPGSGRTSPLGASFSASIRRSQSLDSRASFKTIELLAVKSRREYAAFASS
jgi:hypothetical protein